MFQASDKELLLIQRASIFVLGAIATAISTSVPIIFGLFVLAGDIVSVIVFPQLTCALFLKFTNSYGAIVGFFVSLVLRLGAGEPFLDFEQFIEYPWYDAELGQVFPFRVFAILVCFLSISTVSYFSSFLFRKGWVSERYDFLKCFKVQETSDNTYSVDTKRDGFDENITGFPQKFKNTIP